METHTHTDMDIDITSVRKKRWGGRSHGQRRKVVILTP